MLDAAILQSLVHFGGHAEAARAVSLAAAVTFTWRANRSLTFQAAQAPSWGEFRTYLVSSLIGLAINYGLYSAALWVGLPLLAALALGTIAGSVFNFLRYRLLLAGPDARRGRTQHRD